MRLAGAKAGLSDELAQSAVAQRQRRVSVSARAGLQGVDSELPKSVTSCGGKKM